MTGNVQLYLPEAAAGRTRTLPRMAAPLGGFGLSVKQAAGRLRMGDPGSYGCGPDAEEPGRQVADLSKWHATASALCK